MTPAYKKINIRVSEIEILKELIRSKWHKGCTASALSFLLLEKSNATANHYFDTPTETLEVVRKFFNASHISATLDNQTMDQVYTFYIPL